jgi:peptidyl-tRNA hydrolase, PTH1 family
MQLRLIVGLGNPGKEYSNTRHNAGFWFVDALAREQKTTFTPSAKFFGDIAKFNYDGNEIILLKPQTYMNLSGKSVQIIAAFYKILPSQILVELDFDVDVVKLKHGGGAGGHNGLKSLDAHIGNSYWRLRIGIDHPGDRNKVVDYVLKRPGMDERIQIEQGIERALKVMPLLFEGHTSQALKLLHTAA